MEIENSEFEDLIQNLSFSLQGLYLIFFTKTDGRPGSWACRPIVPFESVPLSFDILPFLVNHYGLTIHFGFYAFSFHDDFIMKPFIVLGRSLQILLNDVDAASLDRIFLGLIDLCLMSDRPSLVLVFGMEKIPPFDPGLVITSALK